MFFISNFQRIRFSFTSFFFALSFLLLSCHPDEEIKPIEEPSESVITSQIDPLSDSHLMKLLSELSPAGKKNARTYTTSSGEVGLSQAIKVEHPEKGLTRYTLPLKMDDELGFWNFIIREDSSGISSYRIHYEPDIDWLLKNKGLVDKRKFTGRINFHGLKKKVVVEVLLDNGKSHSISARRSENARMDCDDNITSGDGSGPGGGGTSGFPDGSGTGGTGSGSSGGSTGSDSSGGGGTACEITTSSMTGNLVAYCDGVIIALDRLRTACDGGTSGGESGYVEHLDGEIGVLEPKEINLLDYISNKIENETDPETKRKLQLQYIKNFNGEEGRIFASEIEKLLQTQGITYGEVLDINEVVEDYYYQLRGQYIMATFLPVVKAAKPFIELALIETGSGVLFQAVKGVLSVKWGVELAKLGVNTTSLTNIFNRMKSAMSFGLNNSSLTLKIGGRNLVGTANSSKKAYRFSNVTSNEAKAIFKDMTAGRKIKRVELGGGKYQETLFWRDVSGNRNSITFRNYSSSGQLGEPTIDISIPKIRDIKIELKFFL